jgi:hypothetical protein
MTARDRGARRRGGLALRRIILPLTFLLIAMSHQTLADSARVGGSVDCDSSILCFANMEIIGTIDSPTFDKFKGFIEGVHERALREKKRGRQRGQSIRGW